ncbi:hypothetical protein ABTX80_28080 [Streptomyces erythrochromogenes]|uniref:hypothetical protein n=1 Tax=Streptomyces erythrochromogenes TaxID=285574 RepID=UPI003329D9F9
MTAFFAFDPTRHGMTCRAWLERISEVSTARLRQNRASHTLPPVRPVRDARLCRAAVAELRVAAPALLDTSPPPNLVDCLEHVVTGAEGFHDRGALRYEALADSFQYGEDHLLFSVHHLVQRV